MTDARLIDDYADGPTELCKDKCILTNVLSCRELDGDGAWLIRSYTLCLIAKIRQ